MEPSHPKNGEGMGSGQAEVGRSRRILRADTHSMTLHNLPHGLIARLEFLGDCLLTDRVSFPSETHAKVYFSPDADDGDGYSVRAMAPSDLFA